MTQKQKENIKHERVLKLKKIGFWTLNIVSYILATIFLIVLIISLSTPKKQNVSPRSAYKLYDNEITEVIRDDTPNNVVIDDENYQITLTADELNDYSFSNLSALFNESTNGELDFDDTIIIYDEMNYTVDEYNQQESISYSYGSSDLLIQFISNYGANNKWNLFNGDTELDEPFDMSITWDFNDGDRSTYNLIKQSIQLDIAANETSETQTIFQSITQVLTNFITTLNSGVSAVINLFWNSTTSQLTLLGNLTTIVIGVAVCFFLFRLVIGLIRLRG